MPDEISNADAATQRQNWPRTLAVIERGIEEGLHLGAQVYVSLGARVLADLAIGQARFGVAMRPDTLMLWLSSGKPMAAVAIAQLWERGLLELDDPVAGHIPEFAAGGKERITIRHLLTHTGGFRGIAMTWRYAPWEQIIAQICAARIEPNWIPGEKAGYHPASSWLILGELVRRLDGRPYEQYVRQEICQPLGMNDTWVGMPVERYRAYGDRFGLIYATADEKTGALQSPAATFPADTEQGAAQCVPGGNAHGPIRELGRFYEMMLSRGRVAPVVGPGGTTKAGGKILLPQTVEALTARHRCGMFDQTFKAVIDWGLGFILHTPSGDESFAYGFGPGASPRTFGHGGFQSSAALADPERQLVVAFVFNGAPGEERHRQRRKALQTAIQQDLSNQTAPTPAAQPWQA